MKYLILLFVMSCGHRVITDGGQGVYGPEEYEGLGPQEVATYAQTVVKREERSPDKVSLTEFRTSAPGSIKRAALVVFETELQPSRTGLATDRNAYLSARGKQLLTEELWRHWDKELRRVTAGRVSWSKRREILSAQAFRSAGRAETDYILESPRTQLSETDLVWREFGQKVDELSLLNPVNYQDLTLLLIPATHLMGGPKPTQHQFHWVNDLAHELKLDAVVIAYVAADWRRGGVDKRSQAIIPEAVKLKVESAIVYPWSRYHAIGELKGVRDLAKLNVKLASYESKAELPVQITVPTAEENFSTAKRNIVDPVMTHLLRLSSLTCERMGTDIMATWPAPPTH